MSIRVRSFTIEVGETQALEQAQDEDCEFRFSFTDSSGNALDLTGAQSIVMTVRSRTNQALVFARSYSGFVGNVGTGAVRFQVLRADVQGQTVQPYDVDVTWIDSGGYKEQLLVASTFLILLGVSDPSDPLTVPAPAQIQYRLMRVTNLNTTGYGATYGDFARFSTVATGLTMIMPQATGHAGEVVQAKGVTGTYTISIVATGVDRIDGATFITFLAPESLQFTSDGVGGWMVS